MRFVPLTLVAIAAVVSCSGCGTVYNLVRPSQERKTFGGVQTDLEVIEKLVDGAPASAGPLSSSGEGTAAALALVVLFAPFADLPLSAVGDALTFPLARWLDRDK